MEEERRDATAATAAHQAAVARWLARQSDDDRARATRGLLAPPSEARVEGVFGHAVWDLDSYAFLEGDPPATVNPSLWRQARLNNVAGLFEVVPGVYQVRGLDISNVTFIAGTTGWVVIDPLTSTETARAALALVTRHLGERPVRAVLYTHSHADHYGGVLGVVDEEAVERGEVEIVAPAGFLEAAVSEQILAGPAMLRRATYMYGVLLPRDPRGHVDTGLGKGLPALPSASLVAPTRVATVTGEEIVLDGVRLVVQMTPGTEAPAEMNLYLPDHRALCLAENCTANLHNLYTLRGAQVRDALGWSKYIDEALEMFGAVSDVAFASHHWPRFGTAEVAHYLASQRDAYRFLHDQALRLANHGLTPLEIAAAIDLPDALGDEFFNRDYYGTVSHNVRAVYQRYLGFYDAVPAHLDPHPPVEAARRYLSYMGGADAVVARALDSFAEGDYRWVAEVVQHVVFAEPHHAPARALLADAYEQLGYQAESGPWRDVYLTGAMELRRGGTPLPREGRGIPEAMVRHLAPENLFDLVGVRLDGAAAVHLATTVTVRFEDRGESWTLGVRHGVVHARRGEGPAATRVTTTVAGFAPLAGGTSTLSDLIAGGTATAEGDVAAVDELCRHLDTFPFGFEIVLP